MSKTSRDKLLGLVARALTERKPNCALTDTETLIQLGEFREHSTEEVSVELRFQE